MNTAAKVVYLFLTMAVSTIYLQIVEINAKAYLLALSADGTHSSVS